MHTEYQWRRENVITNWQQSLTRVGLNYQAKPNLLLRAGYAYIETYAYGDIPLNGFGKNFTEHRLFQMAQLSHKEGIVHFSHRFMLEQRFVGAVNVFLTSHLDDPRRAKITTQEILGVSQRVEAHRNVLITEFALLIESYLTLLVAEGKLPARNYRILAFGIVGAMHELQIAWLNQQVPQQREVLVVEIDYLMQVMIKGVAVVRHEED